jgi:hypothetical protein
MSGRPSFVDDIESLPHWGRVAFAARCARQALPYFHRAWPDAPAQRLEAVKRAIELAEISATQAHPVDGLKDAIRHAIMTAGAALQPVYGFASDESLPRDNEACCIASGAAKAAEWAARVALGTEHTGGYLGPSEFDYATDATLHTLGFVRQVADAAKDKTLVVSLFKNLDTLKRVARRGKWNGQTPVPASVFDLLSDGPAEKPWWRIW